MYARVTTFHLKIDKHKDAVDVYQNSIIPAAKKQNGFVDAYLLANRNDGEFVSITIWDSMENAIANQKSGYYQEQVDKFANFTVVEPEVKPYDVAAKYIK